MAIQLSDHFTYGRLLRFTLSSIAMIIINSIYMVVDGFFVSNFAGKLAFAAINLIMPALLILGTVGFIFGTGGTALVSKTYGEGDKKRANEYFSLLIYLAIAIGFLLAFIGFILLRPIASLLGATGDLLNNCVIYGRIILSVLPFYILQVMFQSFLVAEEKPQLGLWVTISAGLTNAILDALLIILLPQEYKLMGAAIATALSQVVGGIIPLIYFIRNKSGILRLGKTRFNLFAVVKTCTNGASEFMSCIAWSTVSIIYNLQLLKYVGENGLAAYGVMMYVGMIFSSAFVGYSIGVTPLISFHYGAKNDLELKGLLKKSLILVGFFGLGMTALGEILAVPLSKFFVGYDEELCRLTISGFRIFSLAFGLMGFGIFASAFFTALNDGLVSALISFLRTFVFECISIILLPRLLGINGIWSSMVLAETMSVILVILFLILNRKKYRY